MKIYLYIILVFIIPSCKKVPASYINFTPIVRQQLHDQTQKPENCIPKIVDDYDQKYDQKNEFKEHHVEALLIDVPLPLYDHRIPLHSDKKSPDTMLAYSSSLSCELLTEFYTQEMERLGWELVKIFKGKEHILTFQTSKRIAVIVFYSLAYATEIYVYVGLKNKYMTTPHANDININHINDTQ